MQFVALLNERANLDFVLFDIIFVLLLTKNIPVARKLDFKTSVTDLIYSFSIVWVLYGITKIQ